MGIEVCVNCLSTQIFPFMGFELGNRYECKECGHISPVTIDFEDEDALKVAREEMPKHALPIPEKEKTLDDEEGFEENNSNKNARWSILQKFNLVYAFGLLIFGGWQLLYYPNKTAILPFIIGIVMLIFVGDFAALRAINRIFNPDVSEK